MPGYTSADSQACKLADTDMKYEVWKQSPLPYQEQHRGLTS